MTTTGCITETIELDAVGPADALDAFHHRRFALATTR